MPFGYDPCADMAARHAMGALSSVERQLCVLGRALTTENPDWVERELGRIAAECAFERETAARLVDRDRHAEAA